MDPSQHNTSSQNKMSRGVEHSANMHGNTKPEEADGTMYESEVQKRSDLLRMAGASMINLAERQKVKDQGTKYCIIFPWSQIYCWWWGLTVLCSFLTLFFETYKIAFMQGGILPSPFEITLLSVFCFDIVVNFNLAYYNEDDEIVLYRKQIMINYLKCMFWIDLCGVLPLYAISLAIAGEVGNDNSVTQWLGLLGLAKMVRLHRVIVFFRMVRYKVHISLRGLTLVRNFSFALIWTHVAACAFYFIARLESFHEDNTWIGGQVVGMTAAERYVTSLYWSVVTFTTVGYGDFSPVSVSEQIFGMIYMLCSITLQAYIIGSITLLIVKNDEKTSHYRETLKRLTYYSKVNSFDKFFAKRLNDQFKLYFSHQEVNDDEVLQFLPKSMQRDILRKLYLTPLMRTGLLVDTSPHFLDDFLSSCRVERFRPKENIVERGTFPSDLYLLVKGAVDLCKYDAEEDSMIVSSGTMQQHTKRVEAGVFLNNIAFFTESAQLETVKTSCVCTTLTLSRSAYKTLAEDYPGCIVTLLNNLLQKVENLAKESSRKMNRRHSSQFITTAGLFSNSNHSSVDIRNSIADIAFESTLSSINDLVTMQVNKIKDDATTRFLFAASRGDKETITLMCNQGFSPNNADYDGRTALMLSCMNGMNETVKKLIDCGANVNSQDVHGYCALFEAVKKGHDDVINVLIKHRAKLCMNESQSASILNQAVSDGNISMLRRLLKAGIQVDARDYDRRTAAHVAASEGNVVALKALCEQGADLMATDRWNNTVKDEAKRVKRNHVLEFLEAMKYGT